MGLFWYPERHQKFDFDHPIDKEETLNFYVLYYLSRLQSMFKYDGLPNTIPQKWLENYLLANGSCVFVMDGDDLIVTTGGWGGLPDRYYVPTEYIVSNPYVKESTRKTYTIGEDCVLIRNNTYAMSLMPLIVKYCSQLVENDITMNTADILARATLTMTALSAKDKESCEQWLKRLRKGDLAAIGELPAMTGNQDRSINIQPFQSTASTLTDLIEYHQYLKAGLFNELGLNSNYNMKREAINSNESQLNDDMLHPLIDDMLKMRREALEQVNEMFGTNITVDFSSAWKTNEIENEAAIDAIISGGEANDNTDESIDTSIPDTNNDLSSGDSDADSGDNNDEMAAETTEEQIEEQTVTDVIEDLTEAVEEVAAAIESDQTDDQPEDDEKDGEA